MIQFPGGNSTSYFHSLLPVLIYSLPIDVFIDNIHPHSPQVVLFTYYFLPVSAVSNKTAEVANHSYKSKQKQKLLFCEYIKTV